MGAALSDSECKLAILLAFKKYVRNFLDNNVLQNGNVTLLINLEEKLINLEENSMSTSGRHSSDYLKSAT